MKRQPRWTRPPEKRSGSAAPVGSPAYYRSLGMLQPAGGMDVTPRTAMTFSAVFSAINRISTDVSTLPLNVYRHRPKSEGVDKATDDELYGLLDQTCNGGESSTSRTVQALVGHTLGWGNGKAEIEWSLSRRKPLKLHLLDPGGSKAERDPQTDELRYRIANPKAGRSPLLPKEDVVHLAMLGFDGVSGYSPIAMQRRAVSLGLQAEMYGLSFYENGAFASGFLKSTKRLTDEGRQRLIEAYQAMHQGSGKAFKVGVLEDGVSWEKVSIDPQDALFLTLREFQILEIARIYSLPPHKIGDYSRANFTNIEAANLDYWMTSIAPWCRAIEDEFNNKLIKDKRFFIKFAMQGVLRAAMKDRAEFYRQMRDLGAMSPNDIRNLEDMNPIPHGGTYMAPMNMAPLEKLASGGKLRAMTVNGVRYEFDGGEAEAPKPLVEIKL